MKLTPAAVEQLRDLLNQPDPKLIKVGVRNRGCSGLAYHLEYVDKAGAFDETVEQDGVKVLIDSKALFSIIGSEMDWVEDKLSQRFVFRNPNISEYLLSERWDWDGTNGCRGGMWVWRVVYGLRKGVEEIEKGKEGGWEASVLLWATAWNGRLGRETSPRTEIIGIRRLTREWVRAISAPRFGPQSCDGILQVFANNMLLAAVVRVH